MYREIGKLIGNIIMLLLLPVTLVLGVIDGIMRGAHANKKQRIRDQDARNTLLAQQAIQYSIDQKKWEDERLTDEGYLICHNCGFVATNEDIKKVKFIQCIDCGIMMKTSAWDVR